MNQDHRLFERFKARFPAKFEDSRDSYGANLYLRDASAQGVKLLSKERLYLHDRVAIEVKLPDHPNPMVLKGQVIWSRKVEASLWDVGLKLNRVDLMLMSRLYSCLEEVSFM